MVPIPMVTRTIMAIAIFIIFMQQGIKFFEHFPLFFAVALILLNFL